MITGKVTGDASMLLFLKSRGLVLREELRKAVAEQGIRMQALVKAKLHGIVLHQRSGRLVRSINVRTTDTADEISASVGTNVKYAAAHEYGFNDTVTVREHLVRITQAFGKPITPTTYTMPAHERHVQLPERSFLRSTLREEGPPIRAALATAVREALV